MTTLLPQTNVDNQTAAQQTLKQLIDEQTRQLAVLRDALAQSEQITASLAQEVNALATPVVSTADNSLYKIALALTLANSAYDALLVVDESQKIIGINDSAEALFGRNRPIGEPLSSVVEAPELEMMVSDALRHPEDSFEEQLIYQFRTYRVRVRTIAREDYRFVGVAFQDITELVRLNRARRDMVANISHELRTPIANIRLSIDSLFHEQDKPKRKASITALKSIARETDSLLWLVQELYDLSMIESGQAILRAVETPLAEVVQEAIERMSEIGEGKELLISHTVPETISVLADRDQIRRVLINLIHNAIKFSPLNGAITIAASVKGEDAVVSVIDQGIGVSAEHVGRIFERFFQADSARSGSDGTGLGLAICKHIIEAHDGRIWAESNADQPGGRFFFTLPLVDDSDKTDTSSDL